MVRRVSVGMWVTGIVLLIGGLICDGIGVLSDFSFLTNLASSVTAAMFGIPLGVVVLQRITFVQAEMAQAKAAQQLAAEVSREMFDAASAIFKRPLHDAREVLKELGSTWVPMQAGGDEARAKIDPVKGKWEDTVQTGDSFKQGIERLWELWRYLRSDVRAQVFATRGTWINPSDGEELDRLRGSLEKDALAQVDSHSLTQGATDLCKIIETTGRIADTLNTSSPATVANLYSNSNRRRA
jgi:hypothetical protein